LYEITVLKPKASRQNVKSAYPTEPYSLERAKGIEPSYAAWEAAVLPLNYARVSLAAPD
jgi:hypothetical protein